MSVRRAFSLVSVSAASIIFGLVAVGQTAAQDVRHECSEKYQAAKAAGTLSDTWPQFYSKCAAEAKESAAAAEAAAAPAPPDIRHICSEKYQAAKAAGTLNGQTWPQFYSQCTAEVKANPPAAATAAPAAPVVAAPHRRPHRDTGTARCRGAAGRGAPSRCRGACGGSAAAPGCRGARTARSHSGPRQSPEDPEDQSCGTGSRGGTGHRRLSLCNRGSLCQRKARRRAP